MVLSLIAVLLCAAVEPSALPLPPPAVEAQAAPRAEKPRKKKGKPPMAGVLNVNRATEAELRLLPGIGKKRAEAREEAVREPRRARAHEGHAQPRPQAPCAARRAGRHDSAAASALTAAVRRRYSGVHN